MLLVLMCRFKYLHLLLLLGRLLLFHLEGLLFFLVSLLLIFTLFLLLSCVELRLCSRLPFFYVLLLTQSLLLFCLLLSLLNYPLLCLLNLGCNSKALLLDRLPLVQTLYNQLHAHVRLLLLKYSLTSQHRRNFWLGSDVISPSSKQLLFHLLKLMPLTYHINFD